jgi:hypothetical protein
MNKSYSSGGYLYNALELHITNHTKEKRAEAL